MDPNEDLNGEDDNEAGKQPKPKSSTSLHSSSSSGLRRLGSAPSEKFWEIAASRDEASRLIPNPSDHSLRGKLSVLKHKINWESLKMMAKEWFKNPMNWALLVWTIAVTITGAILFLVITGMLNQALPKQSQRDAWEEVNNQIINALFTLMTIYQHPQRIYQLVLLFRWNSTDIPKLRKIYCKNGTYKPHEWAHMLVVILLLNINCFAQYALCGLNVGYKRSERPALWVGVTISIAIATAAIAGVYTIVSPLGKEYDFPVDEEAQTKFEEPKKPSFERRRSFIVHDGGKILETNPEWKGGIFDFWEDMSVTYLSMFCSCCVFGWNMERLGFGNKYVHIATFMLFCAAPFWIFSLAALNIDDDITRQVLGLTGLVLCIFGLCYGGYWRIRMRKRFKLPGYTACCGKPGVSDCALWLCCCWCSLAQEVRTTNFYDMVEDQLYKKEDGVNVELESSQLPGENGENVENIDLPVISCNGNTITTEMAIDDSQTEDGAKPMTPPPHVSIKREGE